MRRSNGAGCDLSGRARPHAARTIKPRTCRRGILMGRAILRHGLVFAASESVQALPKAWRRVKTDEQRSARASKRIRAVVRDRIAAAPPDPVESAKLAGLRYVNDERTPGIRRIGRQNRFRYVAPNGRT